MTARIAVLSIFLATCVLPGGAQTVTPSITIGTHVLTLGMPESKVLEQLGTDLILRKYPAGVRPSSAKYPPESAWGVQRKTESGFAIVGSVTFDDHKLSTAIRNWEIYDSSKSLFYAVNEAMKSLEADGSHISAESRHTVRTRLLTLLPAREAEAWTLKRSSLNAV